MCHIGNVQQQQKLCWCCWRRWHCQMNRNEAIWSGDDHLFSFKKKKSDRNLVWVSLAIKAELWNLGSFQLAQVRNAYTKTTDCGINFGIRVGWFCLLCTTPIEESINSWLTICNVLIDRFLSLQIFRFHNIWIVWLADSALYKLTNSTIDRPTGFSIYEFSDLTIYRLCDWQIPQFTDFVPIDRFCNPQIEIFLILFDCEILLWFYSPHIGRFLNLWTMWWAEFASDRFYNLWIERSLNLKKLTDSSIYRLLELHIFLFMDCQIPQSINSVIGIFCKLQIKTFLNP